MSAHEAHNPLNLLGQTAPLSSAPEIHLRGAAEPQLHVGWGQFHQGLASNFAELFRRAGIAKDLLTQSFFKDSWIERKLPRRAIFAAALWHIAFIVMPFPQIAGPKRNHAFDNSQITWSGPIEDFPLINLPAAKAKPSPRGTPNQPPAPEGADAFHPRQRIFTDPVHPNHPTQTLIQPKAPLDAPKLEANLPNLVQLAQSVAPARPRIEISAITLKKLRPREQRVKTENAAAPEVQLANQPAGDLNLLANSSGPEKPKLQINAGVAPRAAPRKPENANDAAPEVAAQLTAPNGGPTALVALSANPGPPAPATPPAGNLAARVTISPEGKQPGVPGGSANAKPGATGNSGVEHANGGSNSGAGAGANPTAVSITGGAPKNPSAISGSGGVGRIAMPSTRPNYSRADASNIPDEPPVRTGPPDFKTLAPGAKPEAIFARRRVYSMNVNMPNLNSATGSWILNFAELHTNSGPQSGGEIAEPSPLRKVDPKYPPTLVAEHVEGEVILYAVIRKDGSVGDIQVVHGIDDLLNANAMRALAQWRFRPAERGGESVDLEAIVHIPFHAPERQ
jgi:TonB family protein